MSNGQYASYGWEGLGTKNTHAKYEITSSHNFPYLQVRTASSDKLNFNTCRITCDSYHFLELPATEDRTHSLFL